MVVHLGTVENQEGARPRQSHLKNLVENLSNLQLLIGSVGILIYFVIREVYFGFYGKFGLSPSDVGHGRADVVEAAATGLALWLLILGALVILLTSALSRSSVVDRKVLRLAVSVTLVLAALTPTLLAVLHPDFMNERSTTALILTTDGLLVAAVALNRWRRGRLLTGAAAALLLLGMVLVSRQWGEFQGSQALAGASVRPTPYLSLINIRAEAACVFFKDPTDFRAVVPYFHDPASYLGEGDGVMVFIAHLRGAPKKIVRLPSSEVYMSSSSFGDSCT